MTWLEKKPIPLYAHDGYFYTLNYSPDEGGWYGEVSDIDGNDLGRSEIWATRALAKHDTIVMIENLKAKSVSSL